MSMGNMNNGLLTQNYIDSLLNQGGADRLQYANLMQPIKFLGNEMVGLTNAKRQRGGAREDYLNQFQQGVDTLDEQAIPPFSFDQLNTQQKNALMRGERITLDERRTNIGNIGVVPLTRASRTYGIEDFGLELPPAGNVLARQDNTLESYLNTQKLPGQEDMLNQALESQGMQFDSTSVGENVVEPEEEIVGTSGIDTSQETFMQQNQAEYPSVATPEKQKETKDKLFKLGDIFDNKEALGKIALGVALLEGTPIDDAFAMYKEFGSGEDADFELYDNVLGEVIDIGASDNINFRRKVKENPSRYSVNPTGTYFALKSGREEAITAANIERDNINWQKNYGDPQAKAESTIIDAKRLQKIVNSKNFKSGKFSNLDKNVREFLFAVTGKKDEVLEEKILFETIVSKLIPNVRPEGAGATSDFEIDLYSRAVPGPGRPVEVNKNLVEDMIAFAELQIKKGEYTNRALREGRSVTEAGREFSDVMDILYYDKEYNPSALGQDQLEVIKDIYGGKIPIPKKRLLELKPYLEEQARTNSESEFVLLTY